MFFKSIFFSPSINVDYQTWEPVKKYLDKEVNDGDKDDTFYFDHYDEEGLFKIIDTQRKNYRVSKETKSQ